jgi:hypothetical protein
MRDLKTLLGIWNEGGCLWKAMILVGLFCVSILAVAFIQQMIREGYL